MNFAKSATYLETSALLRALLEGDEDLAHRLDASLPALTTRLTWLEADRAIRRALMLGRLTREEASRVQDRLADLRARCHLAKLDDEAFEHATRDFPVEPIRSFDALHLGAALFLRDALGADTMASCDERVRANAEALGFRLIP